MSLTKIEASDLTNKGVTGLPQKPGLSYTEMQAKFDELVRDVVVEKFNALSGELDVIVGNVTEVTVPTTAWASSTHEVYTKKAVIETDKFSDDFIPVAVDMIPSDGSAFFSDGETSAMSLLNQNVEFSSEAVTFYAKGIPSTNLKFRIRGGDE